MQINRCQNLRYSGKSLDKGRKQIAWQLQSVMLSKQTQKINNMLQKFFWFFYSGVYKNDT